MTNMLRIEVDLCHKTNLMDGLRASANFLVEHPTAMNDVARGLLSAVSKDQRRELIRNLMDAAYYLQYNWGDEPADKAFEIAVDRAASAQITALNAIFRRSQWTGQEPT